MAAGAHQLPPTTPQATCAPRRAPVADVAAGGRGAVPSHGLRLAVCFRDCYISMHDPSFVQQGLGASADTAWLADLGLAELGLPDCSRMQRRVVSWRRWA